MSDYKQLDAYLIDRYITVKVSKKDKVFINTKRLEPKKIRPSKFLCGCGLSIKYHVGKNTWYFLFVWVIYKLLCGYIFSVIKNTLLLYDLFGRIN